MFAFKFVLECGDDTINILSTGESVVHAWENAVIDYPFLKSVKFDKRIIYTNFKDTCATLH